MLIPQVEIPPGVFAMAGKGLVRPGRCLNHTVECIGTAQLRPAQAIQALLVSAANAAEVPVIGPVAPQCRQLVGVFFNRVPPHTRRRHHNTQVVVLVPFVQEGGEIESSAVVAVGMIALQQQNRQWITNVVQVGLQTLPAHFELIMIAPDALAPGLVIGPTVVGAQCPP